MIDEDFNTLLTAVADAFDVPKSDILKKDQLNAAKARWFFAHCIFHGHVHLRKTFVDKLGITSSGFYKSADCADKAIHDSTEDLCLMNEIRARVGLPKLKKSVKYKVSNTKTLFGFDYTELDALRFLNACYGAKEYMRKLCKIGREPIPDGMVYSPLRPKRTYNSWYQD